MLADLNPKPRTRYSPEWLNRVSGEIGRRIGSRRGKEEGPLEPLFIPFSLVFMAVPVPLWVFFSPAAWDGVFWYTFQYASRPILLWFLVGTRLFMPWFWATSGWGTRVATILIATGMCTFMAQVHVAAVNEWYGESEPVVMTGTVLDKLENGDGAFGVRLRTGDGVLELRVPRSEYAEVEIGERFSRRYMKGSLGLLYMDD
jgi:hypothetical protein